MAFLKGLLIFFVFVATIWAGNLWWSTFVVGQYYVSAGLAQTLFVAVVPIVLLVLAFFAIRGIVRMNVSRMGQPIVLLMLLTGAAAATGCTYANANVQTLISDDCGVSWTLVQPGKAVPSRALACAYKVTIPNYPMQGETKFKTSFTNRVLAEVELGYEYEIIDGIKFIGEARYLGRPNSDSDDAANSAGQYESAENTVIDKRLRDISTELLIKEDIVDFSQAEFEDKLLESVNKQLETRGVRLNFLSFVPTPEEQTRLAIDMMTAMKVYESRNLASLGEKVTVARAGAPHIQVTTQTDKQPAQ